MTTSWKPLVSEPNEVVGLDNNPELAFAGKPTVFLRCSSPCDTDAAAGPVGWERTPPLQTAEEPREKTPVRLVGSLLITPPTTSGDGSQRRDKRPLAGDLGRIWDGACTAIIGRRELRPKSHCLTD